MQHEPIGKHLSIAHRLHRSKVSSLMHEAGLPLGSGQFHILIALYKRDGMNQHRLCEMYNLDKAAVARAVDKLRKEGMVTKERDPQDKRRTLIRLTDQARELRSSFYDILNKVEEIIRQRLSDEEIRIFLQTTQKIEDALSKDVPVDIPDLRRFRETGRSAGHKKTNPATGTHEKQETDNAKQ